MTTRLWNQQVNNRFDCIITELLRYTARHDTRHTLRLDEISLGHGDLYGCWYTLIEWLALGSSPYSPDAPTPYIGTHTAHGI